jgi:uncharacterized protein (DUF885 family)
MEYQAATSAQLKKLFDEDWEFRLQADPLYATYTGDHRFNDRLPGVSEVDFANQLKSKQSILDRLLDLNQEFLSSSDRLHYDIFKRLLVNEINELDFGAYRMPISKTGGFHVDFPDLPRMTPFDTIQDYENFISRLNGFQRLASEYIELMREGLRQGQVPAWVTLDGVDQALCLQIVDAPEKSCLYVPFQEISKTFGETQQKRLSEQGRTAIQRSVVPGYQALLKFLEEEYLPAARQGIAACDLPNGRAFYQHRIRYFTSLDLTPEEIHAIGQSEVSRIREEMQVVIQKTGFTGSFKEFIEFLRTDPRFYVTEPDQLLKETALVLKRIDGELPRLFKILPRLSYGIRPIPDYAAPGNTAAYYYPGAGDGTRAGVYYVNTYDLKSRPLYEIEALSLHEAVPGHHLQIAFQQELADLPNLLRFEGFTAFVEGWALYAERLGLEVGFYTDAYSNFGRLSYEMWRACRLVVDTGMHALGWTRQQAIDFMADNTSSTLLNITNEVDRYIAWPGQALAYKLGELKIRELRNRAEQALCNRFDLREFHNVILGSGAVPLDVLENVVEAWIEKRKGIG